MFNSIKKYSTDVATMRALWYSRNGAARDVFELGNLPRPVPGEGEVRVKVCCSGVNPSDVKACRGRRLSYPHVVPHSDGSGYLFFSIASCGAGSLMRTSGSLI